MSFSTLLLIAVQGEFKRSAKKMSHSTASTPRFTQQLYTAIAPYLEELRSIDLWSPTWLVQRWYLAVIIISILLSVLYLIFHYFFKEDRDARSLFHYTLGENMLNKQDYKNAIQQYTVAIQKSNNIELKAVSIDNNYYVLLYR